MLQSKDNGEKSEIIILDHKMPYILKKIGSLRNPEKRFRRLENVSKCVKILKKRIFNSTEPLMVLTLYPREEPFGEKPFSSLRNLKNGFVGKCRSFIVSYETLNGFVQNQLFMGFITK